MPMFPQKPLPVPYAAAWAREGSSRQGWTGGICLGWTERENPGAPLAPDGQAGLAMSDTREMALDGVMCGCMGLFSVCGCGGVARNYGPPKQKGGGVVCLGLLSCIHRQRRRISQALDASIGAQDPSGVRIDVL